MSRVITINRRATVMLLIAVTMAIAIVTLYMTGKSYSKVDPIPFEDFRHLYHRIHQRPIATHIIMLIVAPAFLNVCLFVPWGFLMFLSLTTPERPAVIVYVLTILLGLTFSCAIEAYQYFLPTRVADVNDIIWNSVGTALGAVLGQLRRRLRFEFD
jgi:glycopeptide antibiotics resistance protein